MPFSKPPQPASLHRPNPVRSDGNPMWITAGKPILRHYESPAIAPVHAGVSRDNAAWIETAIHPEKSGFVTALATVPASASTADHRAYALGMHRPSRPRSPVIPNLFPTRRSPYAVA